jgi:hypothetical protein
MWAQIGDIAMEIEEMTRGTVRIIKLLSRKVRLFPAFFKQMTLKLDCRCVLLIGFLLATFKV